MIASPPEYRPVTTQTLQQPPPPIHAIRVTLSARFMAAHLAATAPANYNLQATLTGLGTSVMLTDPSGPVSEWLADRIEADVRSTYPGFVDAFERIRS